MVQEYIAPFLKPYCERYEGSVWNGCWAETTARMIDWITLGRISGLTEADIRAATGKPDHNLSTDGGTVDDQVVAIRHWVPNALITLRPTQAQLTDGLNAGCAALLAGNEHEAPSFDRPLDPHFYDLPNAGHSVFVEGLGSGNVLWGNPEEFFGTPDPTVDMATIIKFVYTASGGRLETVLVAPFPTPVYTPRSAMNFTAINPTRLFDSRKTGGKLVAQVSKVVPITGGVVPTGATAITGNLSLITPAGGGWASISPMAETPTTSMLNWVAGAYAIPNGFTVGLTPDGTVAIYSVVGADFVLDVTGYFTP